MENYRTPSKPITVPEAKAFIDHHHELSECIDKTINTAHTEIKKDEKEIFIGHEHNAYVFTKKEILALFGMENKEDSDELLLIVKGAHTEKYNDSDHPAGSETVVLMSVKEEAGAYLPLNTSTGIVEFPWLGNVNAVLDKDKLIIKKLMG